MLVSCLLALLLATCSTVLVLPWFWRSLITRKTIRGDGKHRGIGETKKEGKNFIFYQCFIFVTTFIVSMLVLEGACVRRTIYGLSFPIVCILLFQWITMDCGWNDKIKLKNGTMAAVVILFAAVAGINFWQDNMLSVVDSTNREMSLDEVTLDITDVNVSEAIMQKAIPSAKIQDLFGCTEIEEPVYTNNKFAYVTKFPNGVVIIDLDSPDVAKFVKAEDLMNQVRYAYPYDLIREDGLVVSDDNVPYKKYMIAKRESFFGHPVLQKYVLLDMAKQEVTEYQPDELPEFAR